MKTTAARMHERIRIWLVAEDQHQTMAARGHWIVTRQPPQTLRFVVSHHPPGVIIHREHRGGISTDEKGSGIFILVTHQSCDIQTRIGCSNNWGEV